MLQWVNEVFWVISVFSTRHNSLNGNSCLGKFSWALSMEPSCKKGVTEECEDLSWKNRRIF